MPTAQKPADERIIEMLAHANHIASRILENLEKQGETLEKIAQHLSAPHD